MHTVNRGKKHPKLDQSEKPPKFLSLNNRFQWEKFVYKLQPSWCGQNKLWPNEIIYQISISPHYSLLRVVDRNTQMPYYRGNTRRCRDGLLAVWRISCDKVKEARNSLCLIHKISAKWKQIKTHSAVSTYTHLGGVKVSPPEPTVAKSKEQHPDWHTNHSEWNLTLKEIIKCTHTLTFQLMQPIRHENRGFS